MKICVAVLNIVKHVVRWIIGLIREIVTTVCGWVTTIIRTVREVVEKVCKWLPWPINKLCNFVTKIIETTETVTDWICEEIIQRVVDWIEIIVEYFLYILTWICWIVEWIIRIVEIILCWIGFKPRLYIRVCVKILTSKDGTQASTIRHANELIGDACELFSQCNIELIHTSTELLQKSKYLSGTSCGGSALFSDYYHWFTAHECQQPPFSFIAPITIYFVDSISGANACSIPETNFIWVTDGANAASIAHEIGHLASLFAHSDDSENIMFAQPSDTKNKFTKTQCCIIRSSKYASMTGRIGYVVNKKNTSGCC